MKFKFVSRNAFRDLARNLRRIVISKANAEEKDEQFRRLYEQLKPQLRENTRLLNNQTAFSSRCQHWNQLDSRLYKPVRNAKNPWLTLKQEFEQELQQEFMCKPADDDAEAEAATAPALRMSLQAWPTIDPKPAHR